LMIQEMEENDVDDTSDAKAVLKKFTLKG
jgi:hypothetical protein